VSVNGTGVSYNLRWRRATCRRWSAATRASMSRKCCRVPATRAPCSRCRSADVWVVRNDARAHGNAFRLRKSPTSSVRTPSSTKERTPTFSRAVPMMRRPGRFQARRAVVQQFDFAAGDVFHSGAVEVIDGAPNPRRRQGCRCRPRSGRRRVVDRLLEVTSWIMFRRPARGAWHPGSRTCRTHADARGREQLVPEST